jgi:hypothetical protein
LRVYRNPPSDHSSLQTNRLAYLWFEGVVDELFEQFLLT